jgi:hypothetical protein
LLIGILDGYDRGMGKWLAVLLAVAAGFLWWQNGRLRHRRVQAEAALAEAHEAQQVSPTHTFSPARHTPDEVKAAVASLLPATEPEPGDEEAPAPPARHWALEFFTPHPGENLIGYRDRVLPVVQAAAAPQRKRVRRWHDEFVSAARLSEAQQRELEAAVGDAGEQIKDRILQGVLSGELGPRTKASAGVAFARDLLELADGANRRFRASLSASQAAALDASRFDVVDYLFFATRWEDLLGVEEAAR